MGSLGPRSALVRRGERHGTPSCSGRSGVVATGRHRAGVHDRRALRRPRRVWATNAQTPSVTIQGVTSGKARAFGATAKAVVCFCALIALLPVTAGAQVGSRAMPQFHRVPQIGATSQQLRLALGAGYGFSDGLTEGMERHQRVFGGVGAAYLSDIGLALELRLDGRYDRHSTEDGSDDGLIGEIRVGARYGADVGQRWGIGLDVVGWFAGAAPPTVDGVVAVRYGRPDALRLGAKLGARLDSSAQSIEDPEQLGTGDWLALELSDAHSVLAGVAAAVRLGSVDLIAEWDFQWLFGADAPPALESPMRASLGAHLLRGKDLGTRIGLVAEALVSSRPSVDTTGPLLPYPPRVAVWLRFAHPFSFGAEPAPTEAARKQRGASPPLADPEPVPPAPVALTLRVSDEQGNPVEGAVARLSGVEAPRTTNALGEAHFEDLAPGDTGVEVSAEGYLPTTQDVTLNGGVQRVDVRMRPEPVPTGQVRIYVRDSVRGEALSARVTIHGNASQPESHVAETSRNGRFELQLPVGGYKLEVDADGYEPRRRSFSVEKGVVTVINIELRRGRRR